LAAPIPRISILPLKGGEDIKSCLLIAAFSQKRLSKYFSCYYIQLSESEKVQYVLSS
jgi:hypothetical protein